MSNETQVTVRGFVGTEPTLYITPRGTQLTRFRLGTTPRVRDAATGDWHDGPTDWFTVKVWRDFAENVATSLRKGIPVIVHGNLTTESWASDGHERITNVITADSVGIDLRKGTAQYTRVVRGARLDEPGEARTSTAGAPGEPGVAAAEDDAPPEPTDDDAPLDVTQWDTLPDDDPLADEEYGPVPEDADLAATTAG